MNDSTTMVLIMIGVRSFSRYFFLFIFYRFSFDCKLLSMSLICFRTTQHDDDHIHRIIWWGWNNSNNGKHFFGLIRCDSLEMFYFLGWRQRDFALSIPFLNFPLHFWIVGIFSKTLCHSRGTNFQLGSNSQLTAFDCVHLILHSPFLNDRTTRNRKVPTAECCF